MKTKKLITTAMMLAIGTVLSFIQIVKMPFGGSVTMASMVPIVIVAYLYGTKWGLFAGVTYSIIQMLIGFDTVSAFFLPGESRMVLSSAILICLIDYVLAYTALGLGGVFKDRLKTTGKEVAMGALAATGVRFILHIISGIIFFGSWAQWFFADSTGLSQIELFKGFCTWVTENLSTGAMSVLYSVLYNGFYMIPEIIITTLLSPVIYKALNRQKIS